jgi:hypothetical protein
MVNSVQSADANLARLEKAEKASTTKQVGWPLVEKAITPDTPGHVITEIARNPALARFKAELIKGAQARQALMIQNQMRLNEANHRIAQSYMAGKNWLKIASIDMGIYLQQMQKDGKDCWQQPDYLSKFLRDNPDCKIRHNFPARLGNRGGCVGENGDKAGTSLPSTGRAGALLLSSPRAPTSP